MTRGTFARIILMMGLAGAGTTEISQAQTRQSLPSDTQPGIDLRTYTPPSAPAFYDHSAPAFRRGSLGLSVAGTGLTLANTNHDTLGFIELGGEYFLSRAVSAGAVLDLSPGTYKPPKDVSSTDDPEVSEDDCFFSGSYNLRAIGGLFLLRAYPVRTSRYSFYVDGGIGALHGHTPFPSQASRDNWMQAVGVGVTIRAGNNAWWFIGTRYAHLTSDFTSSHAADGLEYYAGLTIRS